MRQDVPLFIADGRTHDAIVDASGHGGELVRIDSLKIERFRGIRDGFVRFKKHTVLIGDNNAGKTTIIEALTLLFGRDKLIRELTEHDFYGSNPQPADRIKLIATITDFVGDDPEQNSDWFREGRAIVRWLDEETGDIHNLRESPQWKLACQIAMQARFDHDTLTVETVRYFHDHDHPFDPFADDNPVLVPGRLIQQFGYFLLRASRTWDKIFSWGSELFRRTVNVAAAQPSTALLAERDRLRAPDQAIEADPQLAPMIGRVNDELRRSFRTATVQLRLTSTDSRSVMDAVTAHFTTADGHSIPAGRHGSGLVSMQGLLLLLELGRMRAEQGQTFVMALEEPELHLGPTTQHQLVQRVQSLSTQTVITTHSPLVAGIADPTSVLMLSNNNGVLDAEPFLEKQMQPTAENWERRFYQHSRIDVLTALMQPAILVLEGKADFHLLRTILRPLMLIDGWQALMQRPFGVEVGLLPTEDAKVLETHKEMSRLHRRVACLVDGDPEGVRYAAALVTSESPPSSVIRWHDGAMVEDIVGWILSANEPAAIASLVGFPVQATAANDVVAYLKEKKVDLIAYEAVADAIAATEACRTRAAELFGAIALATADAVSPRFAKTGSVWVFQP